MNQQQKAQRYDWLLNEYKKIERSITRVPKLPLDDTLQDINSKEYSPDNQLIVDNLQQKLNQIDAEVKRLF